MAKILFTNKSEKELSKFNKHDLQQLLDKINQLTLPLPQFLDVKKLTGIRGFYRLRFGKLRVILEIDYTNQEIWIRKVGFRKDIYKFLKLLN